MGKYGYTIKSVSDEGTYYLVKDWRKNRELWVSKDNMDRHPEWWFTSSGKAKQSLKSLLSVMDDYLSDTFTVVDMSGNETPLDVKELGFDHIPEYWDDDIDACDNINGATEPNSPDVDKTKLVRQVIKQAKEIRDYFQSHNNNLNRKQEQYLEDLSDGIDNESVAAIRDAIENMKYNSKNLRSEQYNLIMDLYDEFNLAGGKFEGMGYPEDDEVNACGDISCSTKVSAASNYDTKLIAKWLKAKFDDEAFGTAYTMHRISDADAYMGRNGLTYNRKNNTIDLWKSGGDEDIPVYKVVPQYSSTKRQGTYAPKMPKLIPIDEWNATHNIDACSSVKAYSYTSSRKRCTDVTKEVLDYTKKKYPALYKELSDKDIWVDIWGDGEYSLSYNSIKDPNTFLSDSVKQDFMYAMEELYPGSFWGDLTDIDACDKVTASTDTSSIVNKIYSVMMNYEYGYDPDMTDINSMLQELTNSGVHVDTSTAFKKAWVSAHNKAERKTWGSSGDAYRYDSLTPSELEAIENYDTEYWEYVKDHPFNLKPASITSSTDTKYFANMVSASDDGADESEWYDWWNDVDCYLMGWDKEFKQLMYDFRKKNGWPTDFNDPLGDKLVDVVYEYVRTHLDKLGIDPNENDDDDYMDFACNRMLEWLLEDPAAYDFWADYKD